MGKTETATTGDATPQETSTEATSESKSTEEKATTEGIVQEKQPPAESDPKEKEDLTPKSSDEDGIEALIDQPIFDEEAVTESQLRGEEDPKDTKPAESESKGEETKEGAETDDKEKSSDDGKKTEEEAAESTDQETEPEKKPDAPPPGYVPIPALKQARETIKQKNARIAELESQLSKDGNEDFKLLTEDEFKKLQNDDPDEAQLYMFREQRFKEKEKLEKEVDAEEEQLNQYHTMQAVNAIEEIQKEIPTYYEPESKERKEMAQFAINNGFDAEMLNYMTMPGTMILPPKGEAPLTLGKGSVQLIRFIKNTMKMDPEAVKAQVSKELRKQIEDEVKQKLIKKFNQEQGTFVSIADTGGESEAPSGKSTRAMTEEEWAALPKDKQEALLRNQ